jgi:tRNA (cmo5U34)-methyltransferase
MKKIKNISSGDNIVSKSSQWKFSGKTAKNFDKHISKSVPLYEWSHDIALKISDFFLTEKGHSYDLGCSTGTFLNKISKRNNNYKNIKFTGIDEINDMCKIAKKRNKKNKNIKIINKNLNKLKLKKSNLVTSFYTMQFVHPIHRQVVFNEVFKKLQWGGAFIIFEKVRAPDARFQDILSQIYQDFKIDQGYTPNEIISKSTSLKGVMEPFSTQGNLDLLKRAGFKDIVSIMKFVCFEGWLAIK